MAEPSDDETPSPPSVPTESIAAEGVPKTLKPVMATTATQTEDDEEEPEEKAHKSMYGNFSLPKAPSLSGRFLKKDDWSFRSQLPKFAKQQQRKTNGGATTTKEAESSSASSEKDASVKEEEAAKVPRAAQAAAHAVSSATKTAGSMMASGVTSFSRSVNAALQERAEDLKRKKAYKDEIARGSAPLDTEASEPAMAQLTALHELARLGVAADAYEPKLRALWAGAFKLVAATVPAFERRGTKWRRLGFSSDNPDDTVRGGGLLVLDAAVFFVEKYPKKARSLLLGNAGTWDEDESNSSNHPPLKEDEDEASEEEGENEEDKGGAPSVAAAAADPEKKKKEEDKNSRNDDVDETVDRPPFAEAAVAVSRELARFVDIGSPLGVYPRKRPFWGAMEHPDSFFELFSVAMAVVAREWAATKHQADLGQKQENGFALSRRRANARINSAIRTATRECETLLTQGPASKDELFLLARSVPGSPQHQSISALAHVAHRTDQSGDFFQETHHQPNDSPHPPQVSSPDPPLAEEQTSGNPDLQPPAGVAAEKDEATSPSLTRV